jgi:hypothetical protein
MADYCHDLHSGGSSLDYVPFCSMRRSGDPALDGRSMAALKAFDAPISLIWAYAPDLRLSAAAAARRGLVALGGEFGGGGRVARSGVALVERGVRNFLAHAGVLRGVKPEPPAKPTRIMEVTSRDHYVYAPEPGLFEPLADLGVEVKAGQVCGQVHFVDNPARAPVPCSFRGQGLVICQRHFGRVERGDCVAHLASDVR